MSDELVIDENNFNQYFRDCRISRPQRGDVMARYSAVAEFIDGRMKQDIIDLLMNNEKAYAATQVMKKLGCATEFDSIRICKEVAEDLASGMTPEEVEKKVYEYNLESFYYTKKEYIPVDDPHWTIISIANLDTFLDKENRIVSFKTKIVEPDQTQEAQIEDETQV
jgi:hypothetical protein